MAEENIRLCVMIPLHGKYGEGKFTLISPEDIEFIHSRKWNILTGYVVGGCCLYLHREIAKRMKFNMNLEIDHIDGNKLNNCRWNLRARTHLQNLRNQKIHKNNTTGISGVQRQNGKWCASIVSNHHKIHLGSYDNFEDAVNARVVAEKDLWGESLDFVFKSFVAPPLLTDD